MLYAILFDLVMTILFKLEEKLKSSKFKCNPPEVKMIELSSHF